MKDITKTENFIYLEDHRLELKYNKFRRGAIIHLAGDNI